MTTVAPTPQGPAPASVRVAIQDIARQGMPEVAFSFPRTYVVHAVNADKTLDLVSPPDPDGAGLPPLSHVAQWDQGGSLVTPKVGALVSVAYQGANPTVPVVVGFGPGEIDALSIAGGGLAVARVTDGAYGGRIYMQITVAVPPVYTLWYLPADSIVWAPVDTGPLPPVLPIQGTAISALITSGSGKVTSG